MDDESDNSVMMMMMMLMVMAVVVKSHKKQNYCDRFLAFCVKIIIIIFFTKKKILLWGFFFYRSIELTEFFSLKNSHFYSRSFGNFISFFGGKKIKKNWMKKALFQKNYFSFWWNIFSFQSIFSLSNCHQKYFSSSSSS